MSYLRVKLANAGKYNAGDFDAATWIELPADEDELEEAYAEIGISDEPDEFGQVFDTAVVVDYETDIPGFSLTPPYDTIEYLNEWTDTMGGMSEEDRDIFDAAVEAGFIREDDWANFDREDYYVYWDVRDDDALGRYVVDEIYGSFDSFLDSFLGSGADGSRYVDLAQLGEDYANYDFYWSNYIDVDESDEEAVAKVLEEYDVDDLEDIDALTYFGARDYFDLGQMLVDDFGSVSDTYIDYEAIGRDWREADSGEYVSIGYIYQP